MLCMLVKLLITSSTRSSVKDDRRDILLLPALPLHNGLCLQGVCEDGGRSSTLEDTLKFQHAYLVVLVQQRAYEGDEGCLMLSGCLVATLCHKAGQV